MTGIDNSLTSSSSDDSVQSYIPLLHQAIRLGNFHQLPDLMEAACRSAAANATTTTAALQILLWEPTSTGWTTLHLAVSHGLPLATLEYMMQLAQQTILSAASSILTEDNDDDTSTAIHTNTSTNYFDTRRTQLGQSVLDIFLSTYWNPLPWQTVRYEILCATVERVLHNPEEFDHLQQVVSHGRHTSTSLLPLLDFLRRLQLVCRVPTKRPMTWKASYDFHHMVRVVARNGYCPAPVAYLLLSLQQGYRISQQDASPHTSVSASLRRRRRRLSHNNQTTPLHLWAASPSHHSHDGMLLPLLQVYSPLQRDAEQGMYPLQWALRAGKRWTTIHSLWQAAPSVLYTGFAPGWTTTVSKEHIEYATHAQMAGRSGIAVANCFRQRRQQQVMQEWDWERLTMIYCLLIACPEALQHVRALHTE